MALPTLVTASGAGISAANGVYTICPAPNSTFNGLNQYTNGTYFLDYNTTLSASAGAWEISTVVNNPAANSGNANQVYQGPSDSARVFTYTGWTTPLGSTAPAPTFTAPASAPQNQPRVIVF